MFDPAKKLVADLTLNLSSGFVSENKLAIGMTMSRPRVSGFGSIRRIVERIGSVVVRISL